MTPIVVYIELFVTPIALLGSWIGSTMMVNIAIVTICQLHIGIALCIRNSVLLSLVACCAWCIFLPWEWVVERVNETGLSTSTTTMGRISCISKTNRIGVWVTWILVVGMMGSNIWFETIGTDCSTTSLIQIWSTVLQIVGMFLLVQSFALLLLGFACIESCSFYVREKTISHEYYY